MTNNERREKLHLATKGTIKLLGELVEKAIDEAPEELLRVHPIDIISASLVAIDLKITEELALRGLTGEGPATVPPMSKKNYN